MVSDDENRVVLAEMVERRASHVEVIVTSAADLGEKRIVVEDLGSGLTQQFDDGERRRFAEIVDVALVGDAEDEDARSIEALFVAD